MNYKILGIVLCVAGVKNAFAMQTAYPVKQDVSKMSFLQKLKTDHRSKLADGSYQFSLQDRRAIAETKSDAILAQVAAGIVAPALYLTCKRFVSKKPISGKTKFASVALMLLVAGNLAKSKALGESKHLDTMVKIKSQSEGATYSATAEKPTAPDYDLKVAEDIAKRLKEAIESFDLANTSHPRYYYSEQIMHDLMELIDRYEASEAYLKLKDMQLSPDITQEALLALLQKDPLTAMLFSIYQTINATYDKLDPLDESLVIKAQGLAHSIRYFAAHIRKIVDIHDIYTKAKKA